MPYPQLDDALAQVRVIAEDTIHDARIRAVAFDFDDTLVRLPVEWQQVMAEYFVAEIFAETLSVVERESEVRATADAIRAASGTPLTEFMSQLRHRVSEIGVVAPADVAHYRAGFDRLWRSTTADLNRPEHLVPGVAELLDLLDRRSIPTFLVTGGDVEHKLGAVGTLGVADHFPPDRVYGDAAAAVREPFSKTAALSSIDARVRGCGPPAVPVVAFIGDGRRDMVAARAAGAVAVGFNQPQSADVCVTGRGFPAESLLQVLFG